MALSVASGTFTWRTTTGDTVISGLTDPKVIVLWTTGGQTAAGAVTNQSTRWSLGFGTFRGGAVQQNYISNWMTDGNSTAIYGESLNTDAILRRMASDTTIDAEYDLTSMDATSVTLNCPDASASAVIVHYLILGGDDITDAEAHQFALSTAAATQDVTLSSGMGNPSDGTGWLSLFAHGQRTATGTGGSDINFGFGAAKSSTERAAFTWGANDGSGNMNCVIWAIDRAIVGVGSNQGVNYEADLDTSGHPTDGYQLAFADQAEVAHLINAVAIRGNFQAQIGRQATRTSTGDQDIAQSFSEELRGCVFFGHSEPGSTSIITTGTSLGNVFVGATDLTTEGSAGFGDDDGLAFNNSALITSTTQAVQCYGHTGTENSITNLYSADVAESSTNVRLNYTTANGTAREFAYLFLFDAPASGAFELSADPGSYAITGAAAGVVAARVTDASPGSYALTGVVAGTVAGRAVNAAPGSYAVSGQAAGLLRDALVSASPGAYSVTGAVAGLLAGYVVSASPGTYVLTGIDAELVYSPLAGAFVLSADPGAYALTGLTAGLLADRAVNASPGSFALTGALTGLLRAALVGASPGAYVITGSSAGVPAARSLNSAPGAYALTGSLAGLVAARFVLAAPGGYVLSGTAAELTWSGEDQFVVVGAFAIHPMGQTTAAAREGTFGSSAHARVGSSVSQADFANEPGGEA
jgi:hypothetical protein